MKGPVHLYIELCRAMSYGTFYCSSFVRLLSASAVVKLLLGLLNATLSVSALKIVMLDVPSPTLMGESVELTCSYDLEKDQLYSIKWYKNNAEFFRYVPRDWPPGQFLPLPGIRVELSKSGKNSVYLRHVDLHTAGMYKCEISAESPSFSTAEAEKEMKVYVLPSEGPRITGGKPRYQTGDTVMVNCTSPKSKPAAALRWYINDNLAGSDIETEYSTTVHADGLETSTLGLQFVATSDHFMNGNMKLKCTATIFRVYAMSNEELLPGDRQQTSGLHVNADVERVRSAAVKVVSGVWTLFFALCVMVVNSTNYL